jgi:hypothetical protein
LRTRSGEAQPSVNCFLLVEKGERSKLTQIILPLEQLSWSWQRAKSRFIPECFTGTGYGLIFGLSEGLRSGLVNGLFVGPILGLKYGGAACIQHFTLRRMLYKKGYTPWNYAKFLDFTSDRLLMKKIGGGYVFFHRMLLEHFAQMNSN